MNAFWTMGTEPTGLGMFGFLVQSVPPFPASSFFPAWNVDPWPEPRQPSCTQEAMNRSEKTNLCKTVLGRGAGPGSGRTRVRAHVSVGPVFVSVVTCLSFFSHKYSFLQFTE